MFNNYTYKQKFLALLVIFLMLSFAAYKRSFRSLFETIREYRDISTQSAMANKKSEGLNVLRAELNSLNKIIIIEGTSKEEIQQKIVEFVILYGQETKIYDLKPIHQFIDADYNIYTSQLDVTGDFNALISLAYEFEKNFTFSKVISLNFYTIKNNNNPDVLHLTMTFQNYENIN